MRMILGMRIAAVALGVLVAGAVQATDRYVALSGDGSDGSTWAKAYTNVQTAIDAATDGDTIYLKGQTFYVPRQSATLSQFVWTNSGVTLLGGYAGDGLTLTNTPTVLQNTNRATSVAMTNRVFFISGVTNATLSRVTVRGGVVGNTDYANEPYSSFYGGGVYVESSSNLVLSTLTFDQNGVYGKREANGHGGAV